MREPFGSGSVNGGEGVLLVACCHGWVTIAAWRSHAFNLTALTTEEKIELIDDIWTGIDFSALPLTPEQRAELDRRLDRLEQEDVAKSR
jgi:putative addiction module component (TIGR02574 family)